MRASATDTSSLPPGVQMWRQSGFLAMASSFEGKTQVSPGLRHHVTLRATVLRLIET